MILGYITLKYTQSNCVCYVYEGKVIGIGSGQQNRVDCVKLAGEKASFDFPNVAAAKGKLANLFTTSTASLASLEKADAKRSKTSDATRSIFKKVDSTLHSPFKPLF